MSALAEVLQAVADAESLANREVDAASDTMSLRQIENRFIGKNGELTGMMRHLATIPADEKPGFGKAVNDAKARLEARIADRHALLKAAERAEQFAREELDVTLPGRRPPMGREHILHMTMQKIKRVFSGLGFEYIETPDIEQFRYNFDVLNYPEDHPAMDEQDTFYVTDSLLLKTQATAFQGHVFEQREPPFRFFTIGRCYRNEAVDRTHSHTFHQVDAFMVDEDVSMATLKGTLGLFARQMFGDDVQIRFRPDFFPFVEPGVDYAISTQKLFDGRWVELGGAGLVHPNILESFGIDTERYSGFAFGLGVERIPMMAYGVDDLRLFLENDLRFLEQFRS